MFFLPFLRSSMNSSSKMPSSPLNGSCLFKALPGKGGTTICNRENFINKPSQGQFTHTLMTCRG